MSMPTYFRLSSPEDDRLLADRMKGTSPPETESRLCPIAPTEHCDGTRRISDLALQVRHNDNQRLMIWSWLSECLVHEKLLAKFDGIGLNGYRTRLASLRFRDGQTAAEYRELIVTGWGGVARPESGIRVMKDCRACRWKKYTP